MAAEKESYIDKDDLSLKDVEVILTYIEAVDQNKLPMPDYEVMSKDHKWKWPSRSTSSELSRVKGKIRMIQEARKAKSSKDGNKDGNEGKAEDEADADVATEKSVTEKYATKKTATKKAFKRARVSSEDEEDN